MEHHLCISITFLDPLFHGKGDNDKPEWPPSPMRLFQALLAGSRIGTRDREWSDAEVDAFRWLEQRDPPVIVTPTARIAPSYTLYVPNNESDEKVDRQNRLTSKVAQPHHLLDGDALHYLWPIDARGDPSARSHAELLCRKARHLLALGWGVDQGVGNGRILTDTEAVALPGRRWQAWTSHRPRQQKWRVPTKDSLNDLERVYQSFLQRVDARRHDPPLELSRFGTVTYTSTTALPPRAYAAFELPEGIAFRQQKANEVAAMLRSLACDKERYRNRQDFQQQFPYDDPSIYLAGHIGKSNGGTPPRFSYLPLPTIGHEHADGMIRRVLIVEPYGGNSSHARWVQQRLRAQVLRDDDGNDRGILLDMWRTSSGAMVDRYVGEGRSWSTVTPVILPGFDDGKYVKSEKLLLHALRHAGLTMDAITDVTLRRAPFWPGAQHPQQYHRPAYLKHLPGWHAHLRFREPIAGPLAIGAGRHCGLGIFALEKEMGIP